MPTRSRINRCPLDADQRQADQLSSSLGRTLRRMRRDLLQCEACERQSECPLLQNFDEQIEQAIQTVGNEYAALRRERKQGSAR